MFKDDIQNSITLTLRITHLDDLDYGEYECFGENFLGHDRGYMTLYGENFLGHDRGNMTLYGENFLGHDRGYMTL